jgi:Flp pilus assembly protein TadG
MSRRRESGVTAVWTAGVMLFLLGAAALAIDLSGMFQQARAEQRAADLACLAGVWELPQEPAEAVEKAALYLGPNQPGLSGLDPISPTSGTVGNGTATWVEGDFVVEIETPYNGEATQMRVAVLRTSGTSFGRVMGFHTLTVEREAFCEVGSALGGGADMPFGVVAGFTGGVINWEQNNCILNGESNSKCGGLAIPRHDDPSGSQFGVRTANNYIANMIAGINWEIAPPGQDIVCDTINPGPPEPCNRVAAISGDEPSKVYTGLISGKSDGNFNFDGSGIGYLERHNTVYCWGSDCYDGHRFNQVAQCFGSDGTCPTEEESTQWGQTNVPSRVTVTKVYDCDCPRFARIPIVQSFPTTSAACSPQVFDPDDPDKVDLCTAKIIGFEWVYIMRPFFNGQDPESGPDAAYVDFDGNPNSASKNLKTVAAAAIDFAPDVGVEGDCFSEYVEGAPKAVRLIAG